MSVLVAIGSGFFFWWFSGLQETKVPRNSKDDRDYLLIFIGMMLVVMHREHPENIRVVIDAIGAFLFLVGGYGLWASLRKSTEVVIEK